ncbi:MAG TPA: ATPase [Desulfurococcaceae archaeon]|nr:ATPase [Desulfurococcaceae archaeon]
MKIAMFSGGKDSLYASIRAGPIDAYVVLVYSFPIPSPHLVNLGLSVQTGLLTRKPVFIKRLTKGKEFSETVEFLRFLGVNTIVAGDVYIEEHLKYMEKLANEVGASLKEPLWGMDPLEVFYREVEYGIESRIIGVIHSLKDILGKVINQDNYEEIARYIIEKKADVLGEKGEYHTLVEYSPVHCDRLSYRIIGKKSISKNIILELGTI